MLSVGDTAEDIWSLVFTHSLHKFAGVQSVDVRGSDHCSEGFLLKLAQSLPRLSKLTIHGGGTLLMKDLGAFAEALQLKMDSLCLLSCTVPTRALESFLSRQGRNLKVLQLENCGENDCKVISEHCFSLERLSITDRKNIPTGSVCAILKANPGITDLDFSRCQFIDEDIFVTILKEATPKQLQAFRVSRCAEFKDQALHQLVQSAPTLHTLDMVQSKVTTDGLRRALEVSQNLGRGGGVIAFSILPLLQNLELPQAWLDLKEDFPEVNVRPTMLRRYMYRAAREEIDDDYHATILAATPFRQCDIYAA